MPSAAAAAPRQARALDLQSQEVRTYWQFRKCARLHSIPGETEREIWVGLHDFLRTKLHVPTTELKEEDIVSVRRMRGGRGRGRQPQREVVVVFQDVETRDRVCSFVRNLAPFVDDQGLPTAGVWMYVLAHLGGVHKALLQYGFKMQEKYGSQFKRNIRFDDAEHSLCIDVKIPGNSRWVTVSHAHALADCRAWTKNVENAQQDLLSSCPAPLPHDAPLAISTAEPMIQGSTSSTASILAAPVLQLWPVSTSSCPPSTSVSPTPMGEGVWGSGK